MSMTACSRTARMSGRMGRRSDHQWYRDGGWGSDVDADGTEPILVVPAALCCLGTPLSYANPTPWRRA